MARLYIEEAFSLVAIALSCSTIYLVAALLRAGLS